jgi:sulfoxide reductase heme-binding subunit YedZ
MLAATLTSSKDLWYVMRATGLVALLLLTLTVVAGIVNVRRAASRRWPRAVTALLHRNVALLAVVFLGVHILTAVLDTSVRLGWWAALVPFSSRWSPLWVGLGTVSVDLMVAVVVTSLLRARLGHRLWRAVHWLAYAAFPLAVAHGFMAGTDSGTGWARAVYVSSLLAVAAAMAWRFRERPGVAVPLSARRRPDDVLVRPPAVPVPVPVRTGGTR